MSPSLVFPADTPWTEQVEGNPHALGTPVFINGEGHYARAFEVVDDEQSPHPDMDPEFAEWYHDLTRETTPEGPRATVALRADPQDLRNLYLHGKIAVSNPKDAPQDWRVKAAA